MIFDLRDHVVAIFIVQMKAGMMWARHLIYQIVFYQFGRAGKRKGFFNVYAKGFIRHEAYRTIAFGTLSWRFEKLGSITK